MLEWQQHRKCDVVGLAYMAFQQSFGQIIWHYTKPFHKACCIGLDAFFNCKPRFQLVVCTSHCACQIGLHVLNLWIRLVAHLGGQLLGCPHHHSKITPFILDLGWIPGLSIACLLPEQHQALFSRPSLCSRQSFAQGWCSQKLDRTKIATHT